MADVMEQLVAGGDQLLQAFGHAVEVLGQIGDLVAPAADAGLQAGVQLAAGKLAKPPPQQFDGAGQVPGQGGAEEQPAKAGGNRPLQRQIEPRIAVIAVRVAPFLRRHRVAQPPDAGIRVGRLDADDPAAVRRPLRGPRLGHGQAVPFVVVPAARDFLQPGDAAGLDGQPGGRQLVGRDDLRHRPVVGLALAPQHRVGHPHPLQHAQDGQPEAEQDLPEQARAHFSHPLRCALPATAETGAHALSREARGLRTVQARGVSFQPSSAMR
nr:hypothetical protein [Thauera sp. K11]